MKKHYSIVFIALLICINAYTQNCAEPTGDCDGDGITNINDQDDDNDGILDVDEGCTTLNVSEFNGTFGTTNVSRNLATPPTGGYTYAATLNAAGTYAVISDASPQPHQLPNAWNYTGHTSGTPDDAYLAVNGSTQQGIFYSEVVALNANQTYNYTMWHSAAITGVPAGSGYNLQLQVRRVSDNSIITTIATGEQTALGWRPLNTIFVAPTSENYVVTLTTLSTNFTGNDFSIDDISLIGYPCLLDTDGDGIPDSQDTDSDNDGCPDALEGGGGFRFSNIDANGRLTGSVNTSGLPIQAGNGQSVGASIDATINVCNRLLPVQFGNITSSVINNKLEVKWATLSETNNDYFEVEASTDGKNFTVLDTISSAAVNGNSSQLLQYTYTKNLGAGGQLMGLSLFIAGAILLLLLNRRKRLSFLILIIAGLSLFTISCKRNSVEVSANAKNIYIRIAQVDKDGAKKYSPIVKAIMQ